MIFKKKWCAVLAVGILGLGGCATTVKEETIANAAEQQWAMLLDSATLSENENYRIRVNAVSERLLVAAGENPSEWRVVVFENDDVANAFALPNKAIGVLTGILQIADNDAQLATIIGHEISHVQLHHAQERINSNFAPRVLIGAAKLPGAVTNVGVLKSAGSVAGTAIGAGTVLPFGRSQELEADIEGVRLMAAAGYDPKQAAIFWQRMEEHKRSGALMPEFLSTHPSNEHRIDSLKQEVARLESELTPADRR